VIDTRTVDTHVRRLREKLGKAGDAIENHPRFRLSSARKLIAHALVDSGNCPSSCRRRCLCFAAPLPSALAELEHLLTRIGRGEQPPTFLLGGVARARRVGLALERLLARQRELDRQVSKDAAEVRAVLAALTDGLLVVDSSQHILICNPAFEQLYGQSRIATGTALLDIIRDSDVIEPIRAALDQARARVAEVTAPDRKKQLQLTAVPITQNGEASGVVAVFHDISRLKQADEIRRRFRC